MKAADDGGAFQSAFSMDGRSLENSTEPGPRNLLHVNVTAGIRIRGPASGAFASSATHTVSDSGSDTAASSDFTIFSGGPCTADAPASSKLMKGGVFALASM